MRFIFEENEKIAQLRDILQNAVAELIEEKRPERERQVIPVGKDYCSLDLKDGFFILREGMLRVSSDDCELLMIEEGDFVPANQAIKIESDFATKSDFYSYAQWQGDLKSIGQLFNCLALSQALMALVIGALHRGDRQANPAIKSITKGEAIVTEGEISDQVYTLLEGHAQVTTQGAVVGEVQSDELIGVIGALCGIPRIATVTATVDSLVMSLGKDDFIELLSLRPHTVIKLIEDFARIISSSNQALASAGKG